MHRFSLLILSLLIAVSCTPKQGDLGVRYAAECDAVLGEYADPDVFANPDEPDTRAGLAAIAFEHEIAAWSSGMKEGRRPDFELVVKYSDESDGYGCELIGAGGFTVASVSTFGSVPGVDFANRESTTRFAVMVASVGAVGKVRFFLDVSPENDRVERIYATENGEVPVPGISVVTGELGNRQVCDHRGGHLRTLTPSGATAEIIRYGCDDFEADALFDPEPPITHRYDENGNCIEEIWSDEAGQPGRTEFRNTLNTHGDWSSRVIMMDIPGTTKPQRIREEYRHIRYRSSDRFWPNRAGRQEDN